MGQVVAIFLKRFHGGPMDSQESAELLPGLGLKGSADRGGRRQVTLVSLERWEELMNQVGAIWDPAHGAQTWSSLTSTSRTAAGGCSASAPLAFASGERRALANRWRTPPQDFSER